MKKDFDYMVQEGKVVYIGTTQQEVNLQYPVYFPDSNADIGDEYILITIHETKP